MGNGQSNIAQAYATPIPEEEKRYTELKEKAGRFRVLIIGGANAGKTTILQKICNTSDKPEIITGKGRRVDPSALEPTALRGHHNIRNEMVFRSNPTFIFHDSRGFEAGGVDEFRRAKTFVAECAKQTKLKDQVHVIWYCIAMDDDRPITYAERQFFFESGTGKVPVIVVFTKCEALEIRFLAGLDEGCDFDEAVAEAPKYVEEQLKNTREIIEAMKYPPKGYVRLQELNKAEKDCKDLVKRTAEVLDSGVLQGLFISTQQNSLELAIEISLGVALRKTVSFKEKDISSEFILGLLRDVLQIFPYHFEDWLLEWENEWWPNVLFTTAVAKALAQLISSYKSYPLIFQLVHYTCALPILAEHLSIMWSQAKQVTSGYILSTVTLYQQSSAYSNVKKAVNQVLLDYYGPISAPFRDFKYDHNIQHILADNIFPELLANRLPKL